MIAADTPQAAPDVPMEAAEQQPWPEVEQPSPPVVAEAPERGHGCIVDLILRFFYFLFHTIALIVIGAAMFGAAGWGAYYLVQREVRGAEVAVPNLAGLKLDKAMEAVEKLEGADLSLRVSEREFSETVGEGEIISQFPPEGTHVKAGTAIRVKQSKGTTRVTVPDVRGQDYRQVEVDLPNLVVGEKSFITDPSLKKDLVIAQDPPQQSQQFRGTAINLLVSLGPDTRRILMPRLIGRTTFEATEELGKLGLSAPTETKEPNPGKEEDLIFAQDPAPGTLVARDVATRVTVTSNVGHLSNSSPSPNSGSRPSPAPALGAVPTPAPTPAAPVPTPAPIPDMPPALP